MTRTLTALDLRNRLLAFTIAAWAAAGAGAGQEQSAPRPDAEGWLHLQPLDPTHAWTGSGWTPLDISGPDPAAPRLEVKPGHDAYCNQPLHSSVPPPTDLVSTLPHSDIFLQVQFLWPKGGTFRMLFMGRYPLEFKDDGTAGRPGAPLRSPGEWQTLDVTFRGPRFDADGSKKYPAAFSRVTLNGRVLSQDTGAEIAADGLTGAETEEGPLIIKGDRGVAGFRSLRIRPVVQEGAFPEGFPTGWDSLLDGRSLDAFTAAEGAGFEVRDGILAVRQGSIVSKSALPADVEVHARVRSGDGSNAALVLGDAEVRLNGNHPDPLKTGSLAGRREVRVDLIPAGVWCDVRIRRRATTTGSHTEIRLNHLPVAACDGPPVPEGGTPLEIRILHPGAEVHFEAIRHKIGP